MRYVKNMEFWPIKPYECGKKFFGATDKPCGGGLSTLTQKPLLNDT